MVTKIAAALLLTSLSTAALAADDAPSLPPEGKRWVELLIGSAKSKDARFTQDGKTYKGSMTFSCARVAGGWAAACQARYALKKLPTMYDAYLVGWDTVNDEAHWFEVSSMGTLHDHAGTWSDDKTITVTHRGKNAKGEDEEDVITLTRLSTFQVGVNAVGKVRSGTAWSFQATLNFQRKK